MTRAVERYALAARTSNMRIDPDRPTAIDSIIAAGWVRAGSGWVFIRARSEFDGMGGRVSRPTLERAHRVLCFEYGAPGPVARRVLAWWLDPNCSTCSGTGMVRTPEYPAGRICLHCRGAGARRAPYGEEGRALLSFIEFSIAQFSDELGRILRRR